MRMMGLRTILRRMASLVGLGQVWMKAEPVLAARVGKCLRHIDYWWHWVMPRPFRLVRNLLRLYGGRPSSAPRVLGVWDPAAYPNKAAYEEFITSLERCRTDIKAIAIDVAIVFDPRERIEGILPALKQCPCLGSVYQFSSREALSGFLSGNKGRYEIVGLSKERIG